MNNTKQGKATERLEKCNLLELKNGEFDVYTPGFRNPTCKAYDFEKAKYIVRVSDSFDSLVEACKKVREQLLPEYQYLVDEALKQAGEL